MFAQIIKKVIRETSEEVLGVKLNEKEIKLTMPPDVKMGDYAFECFQLARELKQSPVEIAKNNFISAIPVP